jgi:hypothetical protein
MDFAHIKRIAETLSKQAHDSEKIAVPLLASKLSKAASENPDDYTVGMLNKVIARMNGDRHLYISRSEIRELYNKLYSRNTKFASIFADELGREEVSPIQTYNRQDEDTFGRVDQAMKDKLIDPVLASALNNAFGTPSLPLNDTMASRAKTACEVKTMGINLRKSFSVVDAKDGVLVVRASFETPRGETSVLVPVEFSEQSALSPEVFIGNSGPQDLGKESLSSYIYANAGKKLAVSPSIVLNAALSIKGSASGKVSEVDLAITKLNATREAQSEYLAPSITGQKLESYEDNLVVKMPQYKDAEIESFARAFDSPQGIASYRHKAPVVAAGLDLVRKTASSFGLKDAQVSVCDSNDSCVFYAVASNAGRVAFKVPVKIESGKVCYPSLMISGGMPESFSQESIRRIATEQSMDFKTAAVASANYGLKPSELVAIVKSASAEENYAKAEDALNILSQSGDDKAYNTAFAVFSGALAGVKSAVAPESKCTMQVKTASSIHPLCGHLNLPLYKTTVDKNGQCISLTRAAQIETNEAVYSMNSKVFI